VQNKNDITTDFEATIMHRRRYLASIGVLTAGGIAGCSGDTESDNSGDDNGNSVSNGGNQNRTTSEVTQVSVSGEDYTVENAVNTVIFNYATQTATEAAGLDPDSGNKWVILHAEVEFESELDGQVDIYGSAIGLEANGVVAEGINVIDQPSLSQTVTSGASYDGWTAYQVATDVTEATLVGTDVGSWFDNPTEILFEQSGSISATIGE
jgi:hypothetical protein